MAHFSNRYRYSRISVASFINVMTCIKASITLTMVIGMLFFVGCVVPGYPAGYTYGTPGVFISPIVVPGFGYGYWYGGNYWGYRNGYSFYHGHYYSRNGWHGGGFGRYRGYGGGWQRN